MNKSELNYLFDVPAVLRKELLESYRKIASNYLEHRWEPSELNGGKFCEITYWILENKLKGTHNVGSLRIPNFVDACRNLEKLQPSKEAWDRSLRILIPKILPALYEIRNNRGVGHPSLNVNPNAMDAAFVFSTASWILGELIRVFHNTTIKEAQAAVDELSEKKTSLIWDTGTTKRVLNHEMNFSDQTLLLLHQSTGSVPEADLWAATEYSSLSGFRKNILLKLHTLRLIEYNRQTREARISPKGSEHVERSIILPYLQGR